MAQGTLPGQPILESKSAKSAHSPLFVALAFQNRIGWQFRFQKVQLRWSGHIV